MMMCVCDNDSPGVWSPSTDDELHLNVYDDMYDVTMLMSLLYQCVYV
jgi:hypothetical protein